MNRRTSNPLRRFVVLAAIAAIAVMGLAPWPAAAQTFSGTTEVTVVEVPVQVIKDGEPVRGLTANDFEVFDGRKKVQITGFEVLDLATTEQSPQAAAQIPISARRHFLMLFDLSFSEPSALSKARQAAQDVVKTLHPTDLVAVATYSQLQGPQLVLGFTPDRQQISAALETLGLSKLFDRSKDPLRLVLNDALMASRQTPALPQAGQGAEARAAKDAQIIDTLETFSVVSARADRAIQQQVVRNLTSAFASLAQLMGEIDGRKYVVYLSEGFDSSLISGRGPSAGTDSIDGAETTSRPGGADNERILESTGASGSDDRFGDTRSLNAVEKMLEDFRRANCQIQAVDIGGLRAGANQGYQRTNGREALFNMAKSTGGELYENFNNLSDAMGQMLRRTGVTYVLSFQPDGLKSDGEFHKLKVEAKNAARGARVVFRPGYYGPKPAGAQEPALARVLETASSVMDEESGAIVASVLAAPFALNAERAYVPVIIEVNGASLLAGKQGATLPVEIYIYAIDQNGSVQDFVTQTLGIDLTKAPAALSQTGLKFFGHVELPPGNYTLRTLVRNGATGASSLRVTPVEVPAFGSGQAALLPAFFPETPGRWVMVRENPREGQPQAAYPFMLKEQPYIPASLPVLTPGQPAAVVLQGYNLSGDLKADVKVLSADGKEIPGGALTLAGKEGGSPVRVSATFNPPALQPGEYTLQVTLTDGAGKTDTSTSRFAVGGAGTRGGR